MRYRPISLTSAIIGTAQIVQAVRSIFPPEPPPLPEAKPLDPMAGFATAGSLQAYAMRDGAFFLGRVHPDHGANFPVGLLDDRHIFIDAMTRGGKGESILLPNQILWEGPLFAIDPKGEGASITALRRASAAAAAGTGTSVRTFLGQQVAILDPLGIVRGPARAFRTSYNPLADIDMTRGKGVRGMLAAAEAMVQEESGDGAHFAQTARTVIAGLIQAMKLTEQPHRQNLVQFYALIEAGFDPLLNYLRKAGPSAKLAHAAATVMDEVGGDEWGSHRATLSRNLIWLADPDMAAHLAPSAFSLRRAMQEGWSVFVVLPPDDMPDFANWLRLLVRTALAAKIALGPDQHGKQQTLCILDEFATLGHFKLIEKSAGYMAGYGMKLVPAIQNIGQMQQIYARNWETFIGNAAALVAFATNDHTTESYIADRLGRLFISETSASLSTSGGGGGVNLSNSASTARHERPVRFANEVREQAAREQGRAFVIPSSGLPFTVQRVSYLDFPAGLYDSPAFIKDWEAKHWTGEQ